MLINLLYQFALCVRNWDPNYQFNDRNSVVREGFDPLTRFQESATIENYVIMAHKGQQLLHRKFS